MLCLFMCRTYFEIIVYKYFAIGCCKLCRIVRLLGPILLSYIVVLQHFQLWSYPFFYDSKFFSIFVCHLFRLFIVQCFFRSIFLLLPSVSLLTLLPHPHAYAFNFSQSPHVPSSSPRFAYPTLFATTIQMPKNGCVHVTDTNNH